MDDNILRYTLRVNRTLFQKFRYIAGYEGRSANKEIEQYMKQRVKEFEEEHGRIDTEQDKNG
ncbi:MAG: TraY domain-containing protein [Acutalibacteraceae bacterium]